MEETKRIGRVLLILQLIASQPRRWRRSELAERFGISERQIDKDLELIRHGLALSLRHAPNGYYFETLPHMAAAPLGFQEALALILAARSALSGDGIDRADLTAALSRLEAQLPIPVRGLLARSWQLDRAGPAAEQKLRMLEAIERSMADGRKVRMVYSSAVRGGETTERIVRPYTGIRYNRGWYLIGYCELRNEVRVFKVGRIRSLIQTSEPFEVPPDFDLDVYFGSGWGLLRSADGQPERVVLVFNPEAGRWISDEVWHPEQELSTEPDGSVRFSVTVPITPELVRWVLGYGPRVWVESPTALRDAVVAEAEVVVRTATGGRT